VGSKNLARIRRVLGQESRQAALSGQESAPLCVEILRSLDSCLPPFGRSAESGWSRMELRLELKVLHQFEVAVGQVFQQLRLDGEHQRDLPAGRRGDEVVQPVHVEVADAGCHWRLARQCLLARVTGKVPSSRSPRSPRRTAATSHRSSRPVVKVIDSLRESAPTRGASGLRWLW